MSIRDGRAFCGATVDMGVDVVVGMVVVVVVVVVGARRALCGSPVEETIPDARMTCDAYGRFHIRSFPS